MAYARWRSSVMLPKAGFAMCFALLALISSSAARCEAVGNDKVDLPPISARLAREAFDPTTVVGVPGFFRVGRSLTGHWWFEDPNGDPFFYRGVTSVSRGDDLQHPIPYTQSVLKIFGDDPANFRKNTFDRLHSWGFNALGAWSNKELWDQGMPFTVILNMSAAGPNVDGTDLPDVFDTTWEAGIDKVAQSLVLPERNSHALVGYFTDNELDWSQPDSESQDEAKELLDDKKPPTLLQLCLSMKPGLPAYEAAWKFVLGRHNGSLAGVAAAWGVAIPDRPVVAGWTKQRLALRSPTYRQDSAVFSAEFAKRYFQLTAAAIHRYDPNHLILGCRFGGPPGEAVLSQMKRPWVDVVSANNYRMAMQARMNLYYRSTGLPVLITEFSWGHPVFSSEHAIPDQQPAGVSDVERMVVNGRATLEDALRLPGLVGWTWYRWSDKTSFRPPITFGLVNLKNEPNSATTDLVTEINHCAESIAVAGSCGLEQAFRENPLDNRTSDGWRFHDGAPAAVGGPPIMPAARPAPEGFQQRRQLLLDSLAGEDATYFERTKKVPDPNKYAIPTMLAKLEEKKDQTAVFDYLQRHTNEMYPFSVVGLARLLPAFRDRLPSGTRKKMEEAISANSDWTAQGTENHKLMWLTSGVVLASQLRELTFYGGDSDWRRRQLLEPIRLYVKRLYEIGQGEWDSSTYEAFSVQGFLNLYDYSTDPYAKALAAAALDWYSTAMALKYFHGTMAGAERRGFDSGTLQSNTAVNAWLWWGGSTREASKDDFTGPTASYGRYSIYAALSQYRPHPVLTAVAGKQTPLDETETKPSYGMERIAESFGTTFGTANYLLASVEAGDAEIVQGANQWTPWKLVATGPTENYVFTSLNPFYQLDEGRSPYDEVGQWKGTLIQMTHIPQGAEGAVARLREEVIHRPSGDNRFQGSVVQEARFRLPASLEPVAMKDWFFMKAGKTWVAVRPLQPGASIEMGKANDMKAKYLVSHGQTTGFVVQVSDADRFATLEAFRDAVVASVHVDVTELASGHVLVTTLDGDRLDFRYNQGGAWPVLHVDGADRPADLSKVFNTPTVQQQGGRLLVRNASGVGFEWDFTGDWPYYTELTDAR